MTSSPSPRQQNGSILTYAIKSDPRLFSFLKPGDIVGGTLLERGSKKILIDLGRHGTGAVYPSEIQNAKGLLKELELGSPVQAKVINIDNEEGYVELSLAEAGKQKAWEEIRELKEKDEPFPVRITGSNKGGLLLDINGLQAFLPVSQLSDEHYPKTPGGTEDKFSQSLEGLVGQELSVKIVEANPRSNKLIVSEKEATEISTKELVKGYSVGQIVEGIISSVADFGAFIKFTDNPAVEGLIHVSELAWRLVDNPKEVVKVDDVVKAKITEIKDGKISLSLKALMEDPWEGVLKIYKEGEEVKGSVYSFNPFGAIVTLNKEIQGQLHVTDFGSVEEMKKQLGESKDHAFIIESVKPQERRIVLKLKK